MATAIKTGAMPTIIPPEYGGGALVNLAAEIETRLGGSPPSPRLKPILRDLVPQRDGYVVVLFDGLGSDQLAHPAAAALRRSRVADIDTVFPATTTVALASLVTGLSPSQHGLVGYQLWMPEVGAVVNTIKWTTLWGAPVDYDTARLLPEPNLWERLRRIKIESHTVQPAHFDRSPLSRALYRGCRFEPADSMSDFADRTADVAGAGRLVLTYVPNIDFAAHVYGQRSDEYADAVAVAAEVWSRLSAAIPKNIGLLGTADHGHVDFGSARQHRIPKSDHGDRVFYGDGRAMFVKGDGASIADDLPATWIARDGTKGWWGPGPYHPQFAERGPDGVLVADDDALLLHRFSDDRMVGHHGAMTDSERRVPLLVNH